MVCLKYKEKNIVCVKKSILFSLFYALAISFIILVMDKAYSLSNPFFPFELTKKEFLYKIFLLVLIISIIPTKKVRLIAYLTILSSSLFQFVHYEYFGKNIGPIEFYLFITNIDETFETLNNMLHVFVMPMLIVGSAFVLIYSIDTKLSNKLFKFKYALHVLLAALLLISVKVFYITNIQSAKVTHTNTTLLYPLTNRHSARNFFVSLDYYLFGILPKQLFNQKPSFPVLKQPKLIHTDLNRTVILIIGESLRYDFFSLNDNKLTPKLQLLQEKEKIHFKKVYSGGTMTHISVSVLINRLKFPGTQIQIR